MIQLLILFFVVVFIIAIIMLYKKYIRIKNVVDEELDRKYNNVKKAVGSNNKQIKQLKKDASELINTPNNDTNTLQEKINNNRDKIAENRVEMVDNNFQEINKVFKYESGFIVGGNAGQLRIGSDNIQLNVPNPVQVRVCDEQSCDSDIFTKRNIEDSIPLVINENVDSGVDESKNDNRDDNIVYSVDANGVKDNNLEFNNDTKELITNTDEIKGFELIYDPPGNGFPSLIVSPNLFTNTGMMFSITTQGWNKIPNKDIITPSIIATIDETISMSMILTIKKNDDSYNLYNLDVSNDKVTAITKVSD